MRKAVIPGSFDPVTVGHIDIIRRAAKVFEEIVVAVLVNESKRPLFDIDERLEMLEHAVAPTSNIRVASFTGLLVDFCTAQDVAVVVKGLREPADLDSELRMAAMNRHLSGVETLLLPTSPSLSYVSSSLVREIARLGGDVSDLVPVGVGDRLTRRLGADARSSPSSSDSPRGGL